MIEPLIRRAGPSDARTLARIGARSFKQAFGEHYPRADLEAFLKDAYSLGRTRADLADPRKAAFLARAGGRAVGHALAGPCSLPHPAARGADGEVKRLYVLEGWRGGLGSRLLETALAWLEREGRSPIWVGVWSRNLGAQRLYGRAGFVKAGEYAFEVGAVRDREFIMRRG